MTSKREKEKRLDSLEGQLADAASGSGSWSVEWREANPADRPEGMAVDIESRTISFDAWSAQRETLDELEEDEQDIVAFLAGYGAGKSVTGARWLLTLAVRHPGSRFLAVGVTYSEARSSTYRTLFESLPGERTATITSSYNGPENSPLVADYNRAEHRLTLVNDSVIQLGSADKWSRFAGQEVSGIWADEPSHYAVNLHDLLEMMGSRLRGVDGPRVQLWTLTGNGYNDAHTILSRRETADGDDLKHNIDVIRADTRNNPYLSEGEKASFERQYGDTDREEQALKGGFAANQGLVYSNFSRDTHVIPADEARDRIEDGETWRMFGYDAGWNDPRVVIEIGKTAHDQLVALDEFYRSECHVEDAVRWVSDRPEGTTYAEHAPADIRKFRDAGLKTRQAKKEVDAGISEVRERFELDDDDRPGLLVSEDCPNLIRELLSYKKEQVQTSAAEDHCCDAMRYAVFTDSAAGQSVTINKVTPSESANPRRSRRSRKPDSTRSHDRPRRSSVNRRNRR